MGRSAVLRAVQAARGLHERAFFTGQAAQGVVAAKAGESIPEILPYGGPKTVLDVSHPQLCGDMLQSGPSTSPPMSVWPPLYISVRDSIHAHRYHLGCSWALGPPMPTHASWQPRRCRCLVGAPPEPFKCVAHPPMLCMTFRCTLLSAIDRRCWRHAI